MIQSTTLVELLSFSLRMVRRLMAQMREEILGSTVLHLVTTLPHHFRPTWSLHKNGDARKF